MLGALGSRRAFVVHGAGGLDEVSPLGPTRVAELRRGAVRTFTFDPADAGVDRCAAADLAGGTPGRERGDHHRAFWPASPAPRPTPWR